MKFVRIQDLSASFSPDGTALVRSRSRGVAAKVPPPILPLLAFCSAPRDESEVARTFGPQVASVFHKLVELGLVVPPDQVQEAGVFFHGFADVDVHRRMLADAPRVQAFREALKAQVRPDSVVMDAGTGSGLLALLAAQAGARKVYAVDNSELLDLAREVVRDSGFADRVELIRGDFSQVRLPEPVDLIVSETIGPMALAEGAGPDLAACVRNNLKPGGVVMPQAITLWLAPLASTQHYLDTVQPFELPGLNFESLQALALRRARRVALRPEELLLPAQALASFPWPTEALDPVSCAFVAPQACTVYGFGAWFTLDLGAGVLLPSGPLDPRTHWEQQLLPCKPFHLQANAPLHIEMEIRPDPSDKRGLELDWTLTQGERSWRQEHRVR